MQHLISGCEKLAQKEYKRRHVANVAKSIGTFCKKNGLEHTKKWYEHIPERAVENEEARVLWDINVRYDKILIDKKERKGIIIDIAVPADVRVREKEREKMKKCQDLKERDWKIVETQNGRSRSCSDRSPWKCHKRI